MAARQGTLFDPPPRRRPRVIMHVIDAGHADGIGAGKHLVHFQCGKCGHDGGWWVVGSVSEGRKGAPCPVCSHEEESSGGRR